jgi:hypothetical protein
MDGKTYYFNCEGGGDCQDGGKCSDGSKPIITQCKKVCRYKFCSLSNLHNLAASRSLQFQLNFNFFGILLPKFPKKPKMEFKRQTSTPKFNGIIN